MEDALNESIDNYLTPENFRLMGLMYLSVRTATTGVG